MPCCSLIYRPLHRLAVAPRCVVNGVRDTRKEKKPKIKIKIKKRTTHKGPYIMEISSLGKRSVGKDMVLLGALAFKVTRPKVTHGLGNARDGVRGLPRVLAHLAPPVHEHENY